MNKNIKWAAALIMPLICACSDEVNGPGTAPLGKGDFVEFQVAPMSRTMYANDQWDALSKQDLYWGNYITTDDDKIKIFCYQGSRRQGEYKVNLMDAGDAQGSNKAESITRLGDAGVQWGPEGAHTFYAFYPADQALEPFSGNNPDVISARVQNGQSAKAFRAVSGNNVWDTQYSLTDVQKNDKQDLANRTTIYAQPDMDNAVMIAKTVVNAEGYGQPVPLHFDVVADVLDITVNGPVVPNQLGGNAGGESRNFITVYDVNVYSKDGSSIAGDFDLDLSDYNKVSNVAAKNIRNGSDRIMVQLAQTGADGNRDCPVLFARLNTTATPTADQIDQLRVRAFLIPGSVTNLDELKVVVSTDCGEYTQDLGSSGIVNGAIHRIKLGYFNERGLEFDYDRWISQLDPNIYISELSLPGTWHSTDPNYQGSAYTDLVKQYNKGIRAFETHAWYSEEPEWTKNANPTWTTWSVGDPTYGEYNLKETSSGWGTSSGTFTRTWTWTLTSTSSNYGTAKGSTFNVRNNAGGDLFNGLTNLGAQIKDTEFAFVELGDPGNDTFQPVVENSAVSASRTKTITKTEEGTYSYGAISGYKYTTTYKPEAPTAEEWANVPEGEIKPDFQRSGPQVRIFPYAISYLVKRLVDSGAKIYTKGITPTTTIKDVRGNFILKINTNGDWNETVGWTPNFPALFSRWKANDASSIGEINLQWGAPIAPEPLSSSLRWIFSELDNIGKSLDARKKAADAYQEAAIKAYNSNELGYWFEFSAGGYLNGGVSAANCQAVATGLNPYLLNLLTSPTRTAAPMGLVYFNYALDSNATYYGESLIRTIINNNAAFTMRRATPQQASDRTNSNYRNETRNPLK